MSVLSITMFARGDAETRAVAAVGPAGYNSALSRLKGTEEQPVVAAKKPAKKAAKAAPKKSGAPAKKAVAKKPVAAKKTAAKPAAKKVVAKKPAPAKKAAPAKKPVAKPVAKSVPTKAAPAKTPAKAAPVKAAPPKAAPAKSPAKAAAPAAKKPAPAAKAPAKAGDKALGRDALAGPVKVETPKQPQSTHASEPAPKPVSKPVAKPVAKDLAQQSPPAAPTKPVAAAARPVGKVAVAVAAKPQQPAAHRKTKVVAYETDEASGRPIVPKGYKPSPDEEYMSPLQLEYFRQRLLQWRADLIEESKQTIENLKDEVRDVGDEAERATRETENSLELRTRDRYRKLIGKIDSTLKRVDAGEYGYSVDSGEEIGLERLEARLTAERTIDEQERWEHLQKQIGD